MSVTRVVDLHSWLRSSPIPSHFLIFQLQEVQQDGYRQRSYLVVMLLASPAYADRDSELQGSNLDHLPTELVYMISDYLTPCDQACLALCNHQLLNVLESGVQSSLETELRSAFRKRLTRDLADYIHCNACSGFHRQSYIEPPGSMLWPRRCHVKHTGLFRMWLYPFSVEWSSRYRFQRIYL